MDRHHLNSVAKDPNPKDVIATNKLPLHLVSPFVKAYQSIAHFLGNVKYGAWNYRGSNVRATVYVAALLRHIDAWCEGQEDDPTDGTPHLANALACIGIIIDAKHNGSLIDDRQIQNNFAAYAALRERFEELMPKIRAQYHDKNPHHFTREQAVAEVERIPCYEVREERAEGGPIFMGDR